MIAVGERPRVLAVSAESVPAIPNDPRARDDATPMISPRATLPYGPNTPAVRRFLQRLAGKPAADCITAARTYLSLQGTPELAVADRALGHALESSGRTDARDAVVGPLVQLMAGHAGKLGGAGVTVDDMAEAALAAALGLIVGDLIPASMLEVLYRPFEGLIAMKDIEVDQV